jgi:DNA mismatch repair protein MutL
MAIEILPDHVVAQIAAGEVVERPASVVKELLENAIDAGAGTIHIHIVDGGQRMIRVSDDGAGIPTDEVELAFARHATSKLRSHDDLQRIATLGFRGEALFSIASVSRTTLTTRHHAEPMGTRLRLEGSALVGRNAIGAPAGTIITVENLFFNVPARLKFLKKTTTERRQITALATQYAMAYPHIRFVLEHDDREVFRSSGGGQLADVVVKALGLDTFRHLLEVSGAHQGIDVIGYISEPGKFRGDRGQITLFVNGRAVSDNNLTYAVTQAYQGFLEAGQYPIAVLLLRVPPEEVDVNVHPTKAEVRFRDSGLVFSAVGRAVREALLDDARRRDGGRFVPLDYAGGSNAPPRYGLDWGRQRDLGLRLDIQDAPGEGADRARLRGGVASAYEAEAIPYGPGAPNKPRTLPVLRVIGQIGARYIVAEGPAGMYLIDQHAAHSRVLYDEFIENGPRPQPVSDMVTLDLPAARARLLEKHSTTFAAVGLTVEVFGPQSFAVRTTPALLAGADLREALIGMVEEIAQKRPTDDSLGEFLIRLIVRRAAVKVGQILTVDEMSGLVRQLERCATPLTSPEGRPTLLHMSGDHLAREFGR